jgi:hypothetical protein
MGDWLGTGRIADQYKLFRQFTAARDYAHTLELKNFTDWRKFSASNKRPSDIPSNPSKFYKSDGWAGWPDWLGTNKISTKTKYKDLMLFDEARIYARKLNLKSRKEWNLLMRGKLPGVAAPPSTIPLHPFKTYKKLGWISWGDWLGTGVVAAHLRQYRPFHLARKFATALRLKDGDEWRAYCAGETKHKPKLPDDIPKHPMQTYEGTGWAGMGDWIGNGYVVPSQRKYKSFKVARKFARSLKLSSESEWEAYCQGQIPGKPPLTAEIPKAPWSKYRNMGWISIGDWLGTGRIAAQKREFLSYQEAQEFVQKLKLKSDAEWKLYVKGKLRNLPVKPDGIPSSPIRVYKGKGWTSLGNWLGTGRIADQFKIYRSFGEALRFVRALNLKSGRYWKAYCASGKPDDIPAKPDITYRGKGWISMGHWLGTGIIAPRLRKNLLYPPFEIARTFARSLRLKTQNEWSDYCRGKMPQLPAFPDNMSKSPSSTYAKNGWNGFSDWLGSGVAPKKRKKR